MEPQVKHIRIIMTSERYEVAASLFDSVFGDLAEQTGGNVPPTPTTPAEEMLMGILPDDSGENPNGSYFVKPADPSVIRAKARGEETEAIEKIDLITEGIMTVTPDKVFCRMDPYDNQCGEAEYDHTNIFFEDREHGRRVVSSEEIG